jgi:hypothetical protein
LHRRLACISPEPTRGLDSCACHNG